MPVMIAAAAVAVLAGLRYVLARKPMPKAVEAGMIAGWALMACVCLIELALKPVFDRSLALDFLATGQYGFHFFQGGIADSSFPSGHSAQAAAILSVLWVYYARWRWLYVVAMIALALALMLGAWHFFSDIVAGTFIGITMGSLSIWVGRVLNRAVV
jgi:membrane-associated phospholipid phosphatase